MSVTVFVEGGGDHPRTKTACRKAFRMFFERALGNGPKPRITASGSRNEAYRDFCNARQHDAETFSLLLVDSEDPVEPGRSAGAHLRDRDHWTEPLPDEMVHLMVQCMESWFLADKPAVAEYYGQGFQESALPRNPRIEEILKVDVLNGLNQAARLTTKENYLKAKHGFEILERIDVQAVRQRSPRAEGFFQILHARLNAPCP